MLLNNEWVKNEIREEIKMVLERKENELIIIQNLWDKAKAVLRGKFIAIKGLSKKSRNFSNKQPNLHLQELNEKQQRQPIASRRKEITKIRAKLNDIETKSTIVRINESRSWFFEKINKIEKPLSRLIKKKRERTQTQSEKKKESMYWNGSANGSMYHAHGLEELTSSKWPYNPK